MAQQGIHDTTPKVAPVADIYPERPYDAAVTDEHREALEAGAPATRGPKATGATGGRGKSAAAKAKTTGGRGKSAAAKAKVHTADEDADEATPAAPAPAPAAGDQPTA